MRRKRPSTDAPVVPAPRVAPDDAETAVDAAPEQRLPPVARDADWHLRLHGVIAPHH